MSILLVTLHVLILCVGCSFDIKMPYIGEEHFNDEKIIKEDSEIKNETEEKEESTEKTIEFEEDWIEGAPRDVKGREEYIDKLLEIASLHDCSKVFVEYETDGSLYVMIYCQRENSLAKRIIGQIVAIKSEYKNYVCIDFIDQSKTDNEADIVFYCVDIEEDGTYSGHAD